ncbi:MAG TPA: regulatory iron-sulfur-containing complex subunit RicT, partial [Kofleriaceae bacterium]|nr:regulatory iron-sulfur-containing complex subunit RicT [Kofleriaceae bacterium]
RRRRRRRGDGAAQAQAANEPGARGPEPAGGRQSPGPASGPPGKPGRGEPGPEPARSQGAASPGEPARPASGDERGRGEPDRRQRPGRGEHRGRPDRRQEPAGGAESRDARGGREDRGGRDERRGRDEQGKRDGRDRGSRDDRGRDRRDDRGAPAGRGGEAGPRTGESAPAIAVLDADLERTPTGTGFDPPSLRVDARPDARLDARLDSRRAAAPAEDSELEMTPAPMTWGTDDDGPPAEVVLAPDLPDDAPPGDPDPVSYPMLEAASAALGEDVAGVAGVRFVAGGRIQWYDVGEADYAPGERVVVDGDRGTRLAWIAVASSRRPVRDRSMRRVIRRAGEQDLRGERAGDADRAHALRLAKDKAVALRLALKVFRVELFGQLGRGAKLNIYYTSDERLDLRDFIRELSSAIGGRIELRQLGVRDEAKAVGGIGSCGLTLCCTTWLPDFVPVSIKMAKDQGLVLSPTKVSGQCGRLKCCLVYEQAGYAELRKGLPKLGKRVIGARGEGRVVEVDVLRQRVRISYAPGDTEVVAASEVRPMFPSGNPPRAPGAEPGASEGASDDADAHDFSDDAIDLPDSSDPSIALPGPLSSSLSSSLPGSLPDALSGALHDDLADALPDDDPALPDDDPSSA